MSIRWLVTTKTEEVRRPIIPEKSGSPTHWVTETTVTRVLQYSFIDARTRQIEWRDVPDVEAREDG